MIIGLYNLEPKMVNTAMMQVSQYHKNRGDTVEFYNHFEPKRYDKVYAFSIFNFTDKGYVSKGMECGGTGFNITKRLPREIEDCDYDWSLYPRCDFSIIKFSIGCIRDCPFCVVRQKEGQIKKVEIRNLNPNGRYVKVQDNNFFANEGWGEGIRYLKAVGQPVDFADGLDIRLMTKGYCKELMSLKHEKQIKIAWDNPRENLLPQLKEIIKYIKPHKLMCYVLIGYWSTEEEDLYRIEKLRELKIDPFVMPFDKKDKYQNMLARYVNMKAEFKTQTWEEYKKRKRRH